MSDKPFKIEELLDHVGTSELPDDVQHRYELRRTLLCSRYFDAACERDETRSRFLAYTAPLFAGTVLVIVFAVAGTSILEVDPISEPHPTIDTSHIVSAERLSQITFVPVENVPARVDVAEYVDTQRPLVPLPDTMRFVPLHASMTASVQ